MQDGGRKEMPMYDVIYNGIRSSDMRILVKERPNIPAPKKKYTTIEAAGMDGSLIEDDGTYEDIVIPIKFNYMANQDAWADIFRKAKKWLFSSGNSELIMSDDPDYFYKVKKVDIGENERTTLRIGNFEALFLCDPYQYVTYGTKTHRMEEVEFNHFEISHPKYIISGNGVCELKVNGKTVTIIIDDYITVDTDRMLAYKDDVLYNPNLKGEYEDLYLMPGLNVLNATEGFDVKVIPNWRCL